MGNLWKLLVEPTWFFLGMFKSKPVPEEIPKPLEVPDIEVGTPVPVLFGTKLISKPLLAWYGNVRILKAKIDPKGKK